MVEEFNALETKEKKRTSALRDIMNSIIFSKYSSLYR